MLGICECTIILNYIGIKNDDISYIANLNTSSVVQAAKMMISDNDRLDSFMDLLLKKVANTYFKSKANLISDTDSLMASFIIAFE